LIHYMEEQRDNAEDAGKEEDNRRADPAPEKTSPKKRGTRRIKKGRRSIMLLICHRSKRDHGVTPLNKRTRSWG
jgi:hypothetical protein